MEKEAELKVHFSDTQRLVEQVNKRVIGRVVETRQVAPRKRVKLTVQEPLAEPDYKRAFEKMQCIVHHHNLQKFLICNVCCDVDYAKKHWSVCAHCGRDICPACLPVQTSDTVDEVRVFYCHGCKEHKSETPDTEEGYQVLMVQLDRYGKL